MSHTLSHPDIRWTSIPLALFLAINPQPLLQAGPQHPQTLPLRFRTISTEMGLSEASVNAIVQDREGYIWFGTQDGLDRYDGYDFTVFREIPGDTTSISDNYVWTILQDRNGDIWIGTLNNGLSCYKTAENRFVRYTHDPLNPGSLSNNDVTALCEDAGGDLWVGTWGGGLDRLDTGRNVFTHYGGESRGDSGLRDERVRCLLEDHEGRLWIGTWGGLASLDARHEKFIRWPLGTPAGVTSDRIVSLLDDLSGMLWVGTFGGGLLRLNPATGAVERSGAHRAPLAGLDARTILALRQDKAGDIWVGSSDAGLERITPSTGEVQHFRHVPFDPESICSERIYSVCVDATGAVWAGSADGGVSRYDPNLPKFRHFKVNPADPTSPGHNIIRAMFEDRSGDLWIGTAGGGLDRFIAREQRVVHYRHRAGDPQSLASNFVMAVYADREGELWVGTEGDGLDRFDRERNAFIHYRAEPGEGRRISGNSIMAISQDHAGDLWVGTTGNGVNRYDRRHDTFVPFPLGTARLGGSSESSVWAIHEDREGRLWFGTWGAGLVRFDRATGAFRRFVSDPLDPGSLSNNTVWSMFEDSAGVLWFGTWGGGLNRFDRQTEKFVHYGEKEGLPNNVVYGILPGSKGELWLSTNDGIARFDLSNSSFKTYDGLDGLQGDEFNQGAYCRGRDGTLYFGGNNGFNAFQPDSILPNPHVPPIVLTDLRVFNKPYRSSQSLSTTKEVILPYSESFLSFGFASLDYTASGKNEYAYRLEGVDRDWTYCGNRRYAAYTHLDGGTYVFHVKGSNNDGKWNEAGISMRIVITPPVWKEWWFLLGALATAGLVLISLYRYRVNKVVEIERLRTRIAADLHDELASNLSSIAMFSNIIHDAAATREGRIDAEHGQLLARIAGLSQESVGSIRDIIWAIDTKRESAFDLLVRLRDALLPVCRARNIQLHFHDPVREELPRANLTPEQRKDLWLLLKESLTNVVKHASCTELSVLYGYAGDVLTITVKDNGSGFAPSPGTHGRGLGTMTMRATQLGGSLEVRSVPGTGTTVRFVMTL